MKAPNRGEMKVKDSLDPFDVKRCKTTHLTGGAMAHRYFRHPAELLEVR